MKLLIEDDSGNQSAVPVNQDEITIGRKEGNKIRLTERNVSRRHARLIRDSGAFYIEDVKARYGIERNGEKIDERAPFQQGDVVRIGDYRLTLRPESSQAAQQAEQTDSEAADDVAEELHTAEASAPAAPSAPSPSQQDESPPPQPAQADERTQRDQSPESTQIIETEPAELVVISSNYAGQRFPLDEDEMVIGRAETCDITIEHRSVSSTHAKIVREGPTSYKIVDLNSSNGVVVDGDEYETTHLGRGDVIELGHVKFRFVEPGENYQFSPQQAEAVEPTGASDDDSTRLVLMAGALLGVVAAVVSVIWATGLMDSGGAPDSKTVVADSKTGSETDDKAQKMAGGDDDGESGSGGAPSNVSDAIKLAEKDIQKGNLDQAMGRLETAKGMLNPTPSQQDAIDEKMSKARTERPHQSSYADAQSALEDAEFKEALDHLRSIPNHSVFHGLAADDGMYATAFDGLLEEANKAVDDEKWDRARTLASTVKDEADAQSRLDAAEEILARIKKARDKADEPTAVASAESGGSQGARAPAEEPSATEESAPQPDPAPSDDQQQAEPEGGTGGPSGDSTGESAGGSEPSGGSGGGLSQSEAKSLFNSATKKWINGDQSGAIADCQKALQAGYKPCYRVIGMVNKKRGNTTKACRNFKRYLSSNPSDAAGIRNQMDELGCE